MRHREGSWDSLKQTTGGEFRVYSASIRYIEIFEKGSCNGSYPPENVLDSLLLSDI